MRDVGTWVRKLRDVGTWVRGLRLFGVVPNEQEPPQSNTESKKRTRATIPQPEQPASAVSSQRHETRGASQASS